MSLHFDWHLLLENPTINQQLTIELNHMIASRLKSMDPKISSSFSYLKVDNFSLGHVPPTIEIVDICESSESSQTTNPLSIGKEEQHEKWERDTINSTKSSILDIASTSSVAMRLASTISPSSLTSFKNRHEFTTTSSFIYGLKASSSLQPDLKHVLPSASITSLQKEYLPTHICSYNTLYKRKKTKDGDIRQSKRRSEWWKQRIHRLTRREHQNRKAGNNNSNSSFVITKFDLNELHSNLEIPLPKSSKKHANQAVKDIKPIEALKPNDPNENPTLDSIDLGFLLNAVSGKEGGVMIKIRFQYNGDAQLNIATELAANFPCPKFLTIPIEISISKIRIDGQMVIIYHYNDKLVQDKLTIYFEQEGGHRVEPLIDFGFEFKLGAPLAMKHDPNYVHNPNENAIFTDKLNVVEPFVREIVQTLFNQIVFPKQLQIEHLLTRNEALNKKTCIKIADHTIIL
jgi:hypothetical protein